MDVFLGKVTQQAMNYAIRSGISITANFAFRQSSKLLQNAPKGEVKDDFEALQQRFYSKLRIISPAIDMIELISARGNTSLESAVTLTKELRYEIQSLIQRQAKTMPFLDSTKRSHLNSQAQESIELEIRLVAIQMKKLLEKIEDAVPLINLAITTSGASLSTSLPTTVSPSRLLQASTFLTAGDTEYSKTSYQAVQIGPTFTLSVYMLFAGHSRPQNEDDIRETTWKEVMHKARVKLRRVPIDFVVSGSSNRYAVPSRETAVPPAASDTKTQFKMTGATASDEFAYQLMIIEDLDDDRVHDFEENERPVPFDDVQQAGIREMLPVHELSKIFYADTSKVLNIGTDAEVSHPVLLLKRDINAIPPRRMLRPEEYPECFEQTLQNDQKHDSGGRNSISEDSADRPPDPWRLPPSLDPEWIALEVYTEAGDSEDDFEAEEASDSLKESSPNNTQLTIALSDLHLDPNSATTPRSQRSDLTTKQPPPWVNAIRTSLSLLELLLRLTSLQQFQQQSHLSITDELLNFFLEESATTGAGGDEGRRQALRADARRRVGWDPYDESPVKRRGEDYQYYASSPRVDRETYSQVNGGWDSPNIRSTPDTSRVQTISPSPSPVLPAKGRPAWLKDQEGRKASPLRSQRVSDEGIGTSPGSGQGTA